LLINREYRGYVPDWEHKDIYLWKGDTKVLLVGYADIVTGLNKGFTISI
jgi:hypothetical protein